jgi:hypothetical protein
MKTLNEEFLDLTVNEPLLLDLLMDVNSERRAAPRKKYICSKRLWEGHGIDVGYKRRLCDLVFDERDYQVAHDYLKARLPPCRGCACAKAEGAQS